MNHPVSLPARTLRATIVGCFLALSLVAASSAEETADRRGWHGETLPEGLVRSEVEGEYRWIADDSVMVYVPAGPFLMGDDEGPRDERPMRSVHLGAYYIDKYETSWRQWRLSGLPLPKDIDGRPIKKHKPFWGRGDELPVTYMKWHDAVAYADWVGKRLPTEAEWEKAARGTDGRDYPWGDEPPTFERAVWKEHPIGREQPAPVDCCGAGASPYGVYNMVGNVFEWCQDLYDAGYYAEAPDHDPVQTSEGDRRVLRGAAFVLDAEDLRVTLRNRQYAIEGQDYVGFRLVVSAPAAGAE